MVLLKEKNSPDAAWDKADLLSTCWGWSFYNNSTLTSEHDCLSMHGTFFATLNHLFLTSRSLWSCYQKSPLSWRGALSEIFIYNAVYDADNANPFQIPELLLQIMNLLAVANQ